MNYFNFEGGDHASPTSSSPASSTPPPPPSEAPKRPFPGDVKNRGPPPQPPPANQKPTGLATVSLNYYYFCLFYYLSLTVHTTVLFMMLCRAPQTQF